MDRLSRLLRDIPPGPVLAVACVVGLWLMSNAPSAITRVPELEGLSADEARAVAARDGYALVFRIVQGPGVAGTVVGQRPPPGTLLGRGSEIVVRITKGKPQVTVPNVAGMPVSEARTALIAAGLQPGDISYRAAPGQEPNRVIETDPPSGSRVDVGTRVSLIAAA